MSFRRVSTAAFRAPVDRPTAGARDSQSIRSAPGQPGTVTKRLMTINDRFVRSFLIWIPIIVFGTVFNWNEKPFVMAAAAHLGAGIAWLLNK